MVNYKLMNELFMKNGVLSTKELLSIGFSSHDLTRLVRDGGLKRNGRGYYSLVIADRELIYPLVNIIEKVLGGEAVVMLAPLDIEDADIVLDTVSTISKVKAIVIDEDDKKRIILRYVDDRNFNLDEDDLLEKAELLYNSEFYDAYVNLCETLLPSIDNPSSDMYLKLGFSYQQLVASDVNNASKMIDYFTLATFTNEEGKGRLLLNFMKEKYKYDGIRIKDNFPGLGHVFEEAVQYKFSLES